MLVRLPSDLKFALQREAFAHGRRITAEINMRLRDSFVGGVPVPGAKPAKAAAGAEAEEEQLLKAFRKLSPELRAALLALARAAG